MEHYTRTQKRIMHAILTDARWEVMSLFQLCLDLGIDYSNGWEAVQALNNAGLVNITRPRGRDLILSMGAIHNHNPNGGTVRGNPPLISHISQSGGSMQDCIDYPRPDLTKEEIDKYSRQARKLNAIHDERLRLVYVAALVAENVRLLKEVNEHRAARGMKPLPVYDPEKTK